MSMVEHNDDSNGEVIDGLNLDYGDYDKISDFLDFPLESVEVDGKAWDACDGEDFESIPFDDFMGLFYPSNINDECVKAPNCNHNALISVESEQKEQANCVVISNNNTVNRNGADTSCQNVILPETSASQRRSPSSVLESNGAYSSGRSLLARFGKGIPVRARSKRRRPSNVNPWFLKSPITCAASVSKNSSNGSEGKKRPRTTELPNSPEGLKGSLQQVMKRLPKDLHHTEKKVTTKKCTHCHVTKTPQWREGPLGKHTLCNACGVRYRSGRLFPEYRPAASPTFTPTLHSNSHKKVIEMRGQSHTRNSSSQEYNVLELSDSVPTPSSNLFDDNMFSKC